MSTSLQEPPSTTSPPSSPRPPVAKPQQLSEDATRYETRNFAAMVVYQIIIRVGWIFKTESIVMPAVLDVITGGGILAGFLRGLLPVINRLGQSIPPMLMARRVKLLPKKQWSVFTTTVCMSLTFLALAGTWRLAGGVSTWWMPAAFLVGYSIFFVATGINNLAFNTLQGKVIHVTRRGRLLSWANTVGATCAIAVAYVQMPKWLNESGGRFDLIFGFTGLCFAVAAVFVLAIRETPDNYQEKSRGLKHLAAGAWNIVRHDSNFRRLAFVSMAFGASLTLFPHYQALGRSPRLGLTLNNLMFWVVAQNAGTAIFSLLTGPLADRRGNRLVMNLTMFGIGMIPLAAIGFSYLPHWGPTLYPLVFFAIGLTPVGLKTLNNYTLEISSPEEHSRYLSTMNFAAAIPLFLSPLFGWMVAAIGFNIVFFIVSAAVFVGWVLTFRLHEPRHVLEDVLVAETVSPPAPQNP